MKTLSSLVVLTSNSLFGSGISYAATILLAREIGPEKFGEYSYILLLGALITIFVNYSTDTTASVQFSRGYNLKRVVSSVYSVRAIAFLVLLLVAIVVSLSDWVIGIGLIAVTLPALNTGFIFELQSRNNIYSVIFLAERTIFAFLIVFILFTDWMVVDVIEVILILLISSVISLSIQYRLHYQVLGKVRIKLDLLMQVVKENTFLVLTSIATFGYGGLSRLILENNLGKEQLGIYSAVWQLIMLITIFSAQVSKIWRIRFATALSEKKLTAVVSQLRDYVLYSSFPICIFSIIFFIMSENIILVLFGEQYRNAVYVAPWVCIYFLVINLDSLSAILWTNSGSRKEYFLITITWSITLVFVLLSMSEKYTLHDYAAAVVLTHFLSVMTLLARQVNVVVTTCRANSGVAV